MARPCTVCRHKDREAVEAASARGDNPAAVSARFVNLSGASIRRHMADHAPKSLALVEAALGRRELASGIGLGEEVADLRLEAMNVLRSAKEAKDLRAALDAIRTALSCLETIGKLTGKLRPDAATVNVLVTSPDWLAMRERLAEALTPYPEALAAVREAMRGEAG